MEGDLQQTFGRNLRAYRERRQFSQEAFAEVIGVHRTYMGGVERGERNLILKSVERIAEQIGVSPLVLLSPAIEGAASGSGSDRALALAHLHHRPVTALDRM